MAIGRIIDTSSNNHPGNAPIDWVSVKNAGVTTAIVKATQGTNYTNPFYASDVAGAEAAGLDVLAYHFAGFGAAASEVAYFKSVAGSLARIVDIETSTNVTWTRAFIQTLGLPPDQCMTYGSASTLKDFYQQLPSLAWPAAYGQGYPGWGVLWQFTNSASIPGIVGSVDENRWYGTEVQYETLFGLYDPPPDPTPDQAEGESMYGWQAGGQNHLSGVIPGVGAFHWWQQIGGNPAGKPSWWCERLTETPVVP